MLTFHVTGDWAEDGGVAVEWVASSRPIIPDVEAAIDRAWADTLARPGVRLFDGPMCRMESWDAAGPVLRLSFSRTSYKPFLGTNLSNPSLADRYGGAALANPVGASSALETADGYLMLGRRTASLAYYPSRVHPFAGSLEPRDGTNVFATVRRELREELGFAPDDIAEIRCAGIVEDGGLRQPELIFRVRSTLTRAAVERKLDRAEHHATYAVEATTPGMDAAMRDPVLTPVARASLLLWGKAQFGGSWFDAVRDEAARRA